MPNPLTDPFWAAENAALRAAIAEIAAGVMFAAAGNAIAMLPAGAQILVDWTLINQDVMAYLNGRYLTDVIPVINGTTRRVLRPIIQDWINSGEPLAALEKRLVPLFGSVRAAALSVTEVTRLYSAGNMLAWGSTGMVAGKRWYTVRDSLVCFPKWTAVQTDAGERPIQDIKPGDMVLTRKGYRRVIAISKRKYSGSMTSITTNGRDLTATSNHPVWHSKKGWLDIGDFKIGDFVNLVNDKTANVDRVFNFSLGNSNNVPASPIKEFIFPGVSGLVSMPVCPVHFQGYPLGVNEKINGIPSYLSLLDIFKPQRIKRDTNNLFETGFSLKGSVAGKGTELPIIVSGQLPEPLITIPAVDIHRRPSTFLRTVMPIKSLFGRKGFAASLAINVFGINPSTLKGTDGISILVSGRNLEYFSALRADLRNHFRSAAGLVTGFRAILSLLDKLRPRELSPAPIARFLGLRLPLSNPVARIGTKNRFITSSLRPLKSLSAIVTNVIKRHGIPSLSKLNVLYHRLLNKPIEVYDIQVEGEPEFYANGILVHNCPLCGPLHGQIVELSAEYIQTAEQIANSSQLQRIVGNDPTRLLARANTLLRGAGAGVIGPPRHTRCRCYLLPVLSEELIREQIAGALASGFFAKVGRPELLNALMREGR